MYIITRHLPKLSLEEKRDLVEAAARYLLSKGTGFAGLHDPGACRPQKQGTSFEQGLKHETCGIE